MTDASPPADSPRPAVSPWLAGAALAAVCAFLDTIRLFAFGKGAVPYEAAPGIALWYVVPGALAGLLVGLVMRPQRRAVAVLAATAGAFYAAGLANVLWLPSFTAPVSLAVDALVVAVAVVLAWRWLRRREAPPARNPFIVVLSFVVLWSVVMAGTGLALRTDVEAPRERSTDHPSVLFVVVDTLRADHTSLHGYRRSTTPNLDRFAEGGLVFEQAQSSSSWTKPSVASLVTGLPAGTTGADPDYDSLTPDATTMAEWFRAAGYDTSVFSDNPYVTPRFGLTQGFDHVVDRVSGRGIESFGLPEETLLGRVLAEFLVNRWKVLGGAMGELRKAPALNAAFLEWLDGRRDADRPWFAYLHHMEPHWPYYPPKEFRAKFTDRTNPLVDLVGMTRGVAPFFAGTKLADQDRTDLIDSYDGEIAFWDHEFGRLLRELESRGIGDDVLVVVTSDHGEAFFEHGTWRHLSSLHQTLLHVPLIFRGPGVAPGRVPHTVALESVAPTLLALAGYTPPQEMREELDDLLVPAPTADRIARGRVLYWEGGEAYSMLSGTSKWILSRRDGEEVLQHFDLAADPGELTDLADDAGERAAAARRVLTQWAAELADAARKRESSTISQELQDELKTIGYVK